MLFENGKNCNLQVISANKGGVVVRFGHLRGFIPNSHLLSVPRHLRGRRFRQAKANLVGQMLSLKVLEVNRHRRRLVLSERDLDPWRRRQLLLELEPGQVRTGTVRNLVDFGAFVDLGGVDGLIHISELDWKRIGHPSEILSIGQEVEVYVLSVDPERERVRLSRKRLLPDPWSHATEWLQQGNVVKGIVTTIAEFGVFVDLGEGIEGLAHISKISAEGQTHKSLEPGSIVWVRVLKIDLKRRRIALDIQRVGRTPFWPKIRALWQTALESVAKRRHPGEDHQDGDTHSGKEAHR